MKDDFGFPVLTAGASCIFNYQLMDAFCIINSVKWPVLKRRSQLACGSNFFSLCHLMCVSIAVFNCQLKHMTKVRSDINGWPAQDSVLQQYILLKCIWNQIKRYSGTETRKLQRTHLLCMYVFMH